MATIGESGKGRWPGPGWFGAALAGGLLAGPGCATLWDDVTSRGGGEGLNISLNLNSLLVTSSHR
ncbi:MAG: hypothetical protein ACKON9_25720, partial [Planctomycetaceae bacterium]